LEYCGATTTTENLIKAQVLVPLPSTTPFINALISLIVVASIFPRCVVKAVSAIAKTHGCQKLLSPFSSGRRYGVPRKRTVIIEVFRRCVEQKLNTKYIFCKLISIF